MSKNHQIEDRCDAEGKVDSDEPNTSDKRRFQLFDRENLDEQIANMKSGPLKPLTFPEITPRTRDFIRLLSRQQSNFKVEE